MRLVSVLLLAVAVSLGVAGTQDASAEVVTSQIGLNLRTGPSTDYQIITTMPYGSTVTVLSWSGAWAQVSYQGISGWAYTGFLAAASAAPTPSTTSSSYGGGYSTVTGGYYSGDVVQAIYYWASYYGVSGDWLYAVAQCESGLDPNALSFRLNPNSGTHDIGLFQFQASTFYAHGGVNIMDPWDQSRVAAYMFSNGLSWHWLCA